MLKALYEYREMLRSLVVRDLRGRYKNSALGFLWTFLNPLFQLIIYTIVFTVILPMNIDQYYIHLFVALVPWIFFSSCLTGGARAILDQQDLIKKIYFPREILPIAFTTSQFINMVLSMVVTFLIIILSGHGLKGEAVVYLPIVLVIQYVLCVGVVMMCSAITVYLRDMEMVFGVIAFGWMYLSPVIYPESYVPERYQSLYYLNPMSGIIAAYRKILYYKESPDMDNLMISAVFGIVVLLLGMFTFHRLERHFVEEL